MLSKKIKRLLKMQAKRELAKKDSKIKRKKIQIGLQLKLIYKSFELCFEGKEKEGLIIERVLENIFKNQGN